MAAGREGTYDTREVHWRFRAEMSLAELKVFGAASDLLMDLSDRLNYRG